MSSDGNCWDPYCPCKVTRKNIVMTVLGKHYFFYQFLQKFDKSIHLKNNLTKNEEKVLPNPVPVSVPSLHETDLKYVT